MRTIEELLLLAAETLGLWLRNLPRLGTWFLIGWVMFTLGQHASVQLGAAHKTEATLAFVLGIIAQVMSMIMMIHSLEPSLRTPKELASRGTPVEDLPLPPAIWENESKTDVALQTIGPFLAVYAVWGLVDQWVRDLFFINQAVLPGETTKWSVSFADAGTFYLWLAGAALALRWVVGALARRHPRPWLVLPLLFLEGLWVFASFFVFLDWADTARTWLTRRVVYSQVIGVWDSFLNLLPEITLPFGWHLPDLLRQMSTWIFGTFLPGTWHSILLPLMWLALTATVFGWREFTVRDALQGTRVEHMAERLQPREAESIGGSTERALGAIAAFATQDLRDKWVPIGQSLRLIWRSGPRFLAAYLVLSQLLTTGAYYLNWTATMMRGPMESWDLMLWWPITDLIVGFVSTTLSIALYVAAFDRSIADVTGARWRERRLARVLTGRTDVPTDDGLRWGAPTAEPGRWAPPDGDPVVPAWPAPVDAPAYPTSQ